MAWEFIQEMTKENAAIEAARAAKQIVTSKKLATKAKPVPAYDLAQPGRLRAKQIMQILGMGRTTFYDGLKSGKYPPASGKDGRATYWNTSTIKAFLEK